ncbi:MAG: hypothetical protein ACRD1H_17395 [Vicinamibacterales bacterium]
MRTVASLMVSAAFWSGAIHSQKPVEKLDTVAVVGCLKQVAPDEWKLTNASAPVVSTANAPSPKELAELPTGGKGEYRLIGVAIFNLPAHRDHSVVVKGLLVKATPISRLNVTSVTMVSESCPPK